MTDKSINNSDNWLSTKDIIPNVGRLVLIKTKLGTIDFDARSFDDDWQRYPASYVKYWMPIEWASV